MRILILGGGVMQLPAVRLAKGKGWTVVVAAAAIDEEIEALADRCELADLRDREEVARLALAVKQDAGLDGVFTAGTDFSTTVAWVAEQAKLPGIPYASALAATDKSLMRRAFRAHGVPSPEFFTAEEPSGYPPPGFSFPLVVKPVDNMGARGVRRVDSQEQLLQALEAALEQSACGKAIVERYLEGPELSLDAVVYDGTVTVCGVADRHICFPPYFVEMGHTMPTVLDEEKVRLAEEVFERGIRALGISRGAAKGDIKITPDGPVVGEIAARLSGGYMSGWTFPFASGVEVTEAALNIAVGLPPGDLTPKRRWVSAERAFISIPGTVKALEGLQAARALPCIEELFVRVSPGGRVQLPINNMGKCGNLISKAASREQSVEAVQQAVQSVLVRLEACDPRTDAYLAGEERNGFSAFSRISLETERAVGELPAWVGDPELFGRKTGHLRVLPLRGAGRESERDWHGWSLQDALRRVLEITKVRQSNGRQAVGSPSALRKSEPAPGTLLLGRVFWKALVRGGVQAGVYVIDTLCDPAASPKQVLRRWSA
jgi:biotin carboxylase